MTPVLGPRLIDALLGGLVEGRLDLTLLAPRDALEMIQSRHQSVYESAIENRRLAAGVYDEDVLYGLFLRENVLVLVGYDEHNFVRCIVENDSQTALEWGSDLFREREQRVESYDTWSDSGGQSQ